MKNLPHIFLMCFSIILCSCLSPKNVQNPDLSDYFNYDFYDLEGTYNLGAVITIKDGRIKSPVVTYDLSNMKNNIDTLSVARRNIDITRNFSNQLNAFVFSNIGLDNGYSKVGKVDVKIKDAFVRFLRNSEKVIENIADNKSYRNNLLSHLNRNDIDTFYIITRVMEFNDAEFNISVEKDLSGQFSIDAQNAKLGDTIKINDKSKFTIIFNKDKKPIPVAFNAEMITYKELENWRQVDKIFYYRRLKDELEFKHIEFKVYNSRQLNLTGKLINYSNKIKKAQLRIELLEKDEEEPFKIITTNVFRVRGKAIHIKEQEQKNSINIAINEELGNISIEDKKRLYHVRFIFVEKTI